MRREPIIFIIPKYYFLLLIIGFVLLTLGSFRLIYTLSPGIEGKIIVIDPGHGGQDPGAQYQGIQEKNINLDVALHLKKVLETKGCKVILTRDSDKDFFIPGFVKGRMAKRLELNQRINIASTINADLFISIHTNSFSQSSSHGMEAFYHIKSPEGKVLAESIQKEMTAIRPNNKRKSKAGDYYLLNQTKMPAVLIEIGYLSNYGDRQFLLNEKNRFLLADSIAKGIDNYFKDYPFGVPDSNPAISNISSPKISGDDFFNLYYPSSSLEQLTNEERTISKQLWLSLNQNQKIAYIVKELIKGPTLTNTVSLIPKDTSLLSATLINGIATLNFNEKLRESFTGGALEEEMAIKSIVWSTSQITGVSGVRILINGQQEDFIGEHVILNHTFSPVPKTAKAAIVIDDFGINNPGTNDMLNLGIPFTAAVMPNLQFSQQEASMLHNKGYEIILHMPMEAQNGHSEWLGPGALKTSLTKKECEQKLTQAFQTVPYAVGISNHMGSKITEDLRISEIIADFAKRNNLFILDSKTTEASVLAAEAQKALLPYGIRDVFLDNSSDISSIKEQIKLLIEKAKTNGKAIGIGHVGPQGPFTAKAIREMYPEFEKQGIQIVPLSELIKS